MKVEHKDLLMDLFAERAKEHPEYDDYFIDLDDLEKIVEEFFNKTENLEFMIDNLPENRCLCRDSGLWQIRNEEMVMCYYEQDVNETFSQFIKRAFDCENQLYAELDNV